MQELEQCRICPRECGINRNHGETGYCGMTADVRIARATLHFWEEPCISGKEGSGTVFFAGCNLGCVYCQNHNISFASNKNIGKVVTLDELAETFLRLMSDGANNINLVTPTHYALHIAKAIEMAKDRGLSIPILYNTGSYEKTETLKKLEGLVDIYLPDLKYVSPELSKEYSFAEDYFEKASLAIEEMVRQTGTCDFDERGIIKKGVIVRNLILPGHTKESKKVIKYLHQTYGNKIYISIMNQYTPFTWVGEKYPQINRKVTKREYDKVVKEALDMGVINGFIQEGDTAKDSFIPDFQNNQN